MKKTVWILLDNRVGSRHQAEGVANYLPLSAFNTIKKEIEYNKWAALPNFIRQNTLLGLTARTKASLTAPYPDLILSSSRRTAPVARWIKKQNQATKLIQLMHIGKTGIKDFSLIFVPEHDKQKSTAPNMRYILGCPHFITPEKLDNAKKQWEDTFSNLPRPLTALIIGGAIKKHPFTLENAEKLASAVKNIKNQEGGSLLITTSRRTGAAAEQEIMSILNEIPHFSYLWGNSGDNPYTGFLACADNIIVTGDSVSMCCEAAAAGKPLKIFTGTSWLTKKHQRFVDSLCQKGFAARLENSAPDISPKRQSPLNTAELIAAEISRL